MPMVNGYWVGTGESPNPSGACCWMYEAVAPGFMALLEFTALELLLLLLLLLADEGELL